MSAAVLRMTPSEVASWWAEGLRRQGRFAQVATHVGRLLKLYGEVFPIQIKRRIPEMGSNVHAHLSGLVAGGVLLRDRVAHGRYVAASPLVPSPEDQILLIGSVLASLDAESMALQSVIGHPLLFPFSIPWNPPLLRQTELIEVSYDSERNTLVHQPARKKQKGKSRHAVEDAVGD